MRSSADTNGHDYVVRSDANEPSSAGKPNCNTPPRAPLPVVKLVGKLPRTGAGTGAGAMPCPLPMPMEPPPLPAPADELLAGEGGLLYSPASRSQHIDKLLPPLEEDKKVRSQSKSISRMARRSGQRSSSPPSFPHQPLVPPTNTNANEVTRHKPGPTKFGNFGNGLGREPRFLSKLEAQVSVCTCATSMQKQGAAENKMLHGRHDMLCAAFVRCPLCGTLC